jgi:hypothetical protein
VKSSNAPKPSSHRSGCSLSGEFCGKDKATTTCKESTLVNNAKHSHFYFIIIQPLLRRYSSLLVGKYTNKLYTLLRCVVLWCVVVCYMFTHSPSLCITCCHSPSLSITLHHSPSLSLSLSLTLSHSPSLSLTLHHYLTLPPSPSLSLTLPHSPSLPLARRHERRFFDLLLQKANRIVGLLENQQPHVL